MDPATGTEGSTPTDTGTPAAAPPGDAGASQGDPAQGGSAPPPATQPAAPAPGQKPDDAAPPPPEPRANLTARLAALSRENREATRRARDAEAAARTAEAKATEAASKASELDALLTKAKDDPSIIPQLFERAGLSFERVVNFYAEQGAEKTPEQAQAQALADLRKEVEAQKKAREEDAKAAAERAAENSRVEQIAGIAQAIQKQADKFEICARLGDEAATDVFGEVVKAWNKAGRPQLMPGEYEEAVQAALELKELEYEERGKKLQKAARAAAAAAGAPVGGAPSAAAAGEKPTGLAPKNSDLPAGLVAAGLSDKDADILKGLTDKTAPAYDSQRAKPRTISSSLGGSAPPRAPARGAMDPRDALRDVLATVPGYVRQ